jgi:hypothetical protein
VVLGSIPLVIGTPIQGDGYEYEDLDDGEIEIHGDFAEADDSSGSKNHSPSFTGGTDQTVDEDSGSHAVPGWASALSAGPASEASQLLDFVVTNDNSSLFSTPPSIAADGTLSYTLAPGATGSATVSVALHDNGGTRNGGADTSAATTFGISVTPVPLGISSAFDYLSSGALTINFSRDVGSIPPAAIQVIDLATGDPVALQPASYDPALHRATVGFDPATLPDGNYRLTIPVGAFPNMLGPAQLDFFVMAGDANRDHAVNSLDFDALALNFNAAGMNFGQGDFNYDGKVNALDFNVLASRFGSTLPAAPTSATALAAPMALGSLFSNTAVASKWTDVLV